MNTQSSEPATDPTAEQASSTAPAALNDLIAAGLVSHELIGDPVHIGAEAPALGKLCGMIAGPIYRIDPFHYAFRAGPGDLSGRLGDLAPADWTAALDEAMRAAFGAEAIWLNATDLLTGEEAPLDHPLLFLRAHATAVTEASPGFQAVVNARYATETAHLTARLSGAVETGSELATRLAEIEQRQGEILQRLAEPARAIEPDPAFARLANGLAETLAVISRRLDSQSGTLTAHTARVEGMAGALTALSQRLETQIESGQILAARADGMVETLGMISQRLEVQDETGRTSAGHVEGIAEALATISQRLETRDPVDGAVLIAISGRLDAQVEAGQTLAAQVEGIAETLTAISQRLNKQAENGHIRAGRVETVLEALGLISQRLDAQFETGQVRAAQVDSLAGTLSTISERLEAQSETGQAQAARVDGMVESLVAISQRLDAQAGALDIHMARADGMAERLAELATLSGGPAIFQETLGLTLAEFLARLEYQAAQATPARAPRFS